LQSAFYKNIDLQKKMSSIRSCESSLWCLVDLREESATYGYEKRPILTAVRNFGQCANAWPSELMVQMKATAAVNVVF